MKCVRNSVLLMALLLSHQYVLKAQCAANGSGGSTVYINSTWWPTSGNPFASQRNSGAGSYTDNTGFGSQRTLKAGFNQVPDNQVAFAVPHGANVNWFYKVYLDLDRNGDFDASEEMASGNLNIPFAGLSSTSLVLHLTTANAGTARIRYMVKFGSDITGPCETGFNGEVEDWLVTLPHINVKPTVSAEDTNIQGDDANDIVFSSTNSSLISIADGNSDNQTVTLSVSGGGNFSLSTTSGLSFSTGDGTDDTAMTFSGSLADVNAALANARFKSGGTKGLHQISISTNDGTESSTNKTIFLSVSDGDYPDMIVKTGDNPVAATQDASGNIYSIEFDGSSNFDVIRYPSGSSTGSIISDGTTTFNAATGEVPTDIEVASNGDVYFLEVRSDGSGGSGKIIKLDESSSYAASNVATGGFYTALAIDDSDNIYVCEFDAGNNEYDIVKYTGGSGPGTVLYNGLSHGGTPGSYPWGLTIADNGDIYVLNSWNTSNGQILKLTAPGYSTSTVVESGGKYTGMAMDSNNDLYALKFNSTDNVYEVHKYTGGSGPSELIYTALTSSGNFLPHGIGINRSRTDIILADPWNLNAVIKLTNNDVPAIPTSATIEATVFLEGAFNGTNHNTMLNTDIPLTQPYSNNGHSGGSAGSIPANAVDWVLVELREAGSAAAALSSTKVGSAAGFVMNDGTIKATDGFNNLNISLSGNSGADFFMVIYHRNHLSIMSANAIVGNRGVYTVDFTTASATTHQGILGLASLPGGKFGMLAGDADGDGDVDGTDLTTWRSQNGGVFSYNSTNGDFNLDGEVNAVDRNDFQQKNNSKSSQVPTT